MSRHVFTVGEANSLVPTLTQTFQQIDAHKYQIREATKKIEVLDLLWGNAVRDPSNADHKDYMAHRETVDRALRGIQRSIQEGVIAHGLRLPLGGIEEGLVDFPTTYQGRWVYLCWHMGEREIQYWHETDTGFQGRQEITAAQRDEMGRDDPADLDDSELDF
ncbi:MAG TPA: DUF2203 domain-containing protein [Candidatus Krumholzibacteria bacterium]|nr:DUF2203 domain-containing protein [Candidatus Krumholzibacteria bacterium]